MLTLILCLYKLKGNPVLESEWWPSNTLLLEAMSHYGRNLILKSPRASILNTTLLTFPCRSASDAKLAKNARGLLSSQCLVCPSWVSVETWQCNMVDFIREDPILKRHILNQQKHNFYLHGIIH